MSPRWIAWQRVLPLRWVWHSTVTVSPVCNALAALLGTRTRDATRETSGSELSQAVLAAMAAAGVAEYRLGNRCTVSLITRTVPVVVARISWMKPVVLSVCALAELARSETITVQRMATVVRMVVAVPFRPGKSGSEM